MIIPLKIKEAVYAFIMLFRSKRRIRPPHASIIPGTSIYDIELMDISGKNRILAEFKGRKMLIVNLASECGYTPQYAKLQDLYEKFHEKIVVLGFPSNDFGSQEPGSNPEILMFCKSEYKVAFPLFEKSAVIGLDVNPLYKWLTDKNLNGWNSQSPIWNFCKYLIDENGRLLRFYSQTVSPFDVELLDKLEIDT